MYHFIGIKGSGMSALAQIMHELGYSVQGSDLEKHFFTEDGLRELGIKTIPKEFACIENDMIRHDSTNVADSIIELICEDLKFKDMQNNPQYIRMNKKLQANEEKRRQKTKLKTKKKRIEKKANKKARRMDDRRKSKFNSKYNERIKSIKNSEETRQENIRAFEEDEE